MVVAVSIQSPSCLAQETVLRRPDSPRVHHCVSLALHPRLALRLIQHSFRPVFSRSIVMSIICSRLRFDDSISIQLVTCVCKLLVLTPLHNRQKRKTQELFLLSYFFTIIFCGDQHPFSSSITSFSDPIFARTIITSCRIDHGSSRDKFEQQSSTTPYTINSCPIIRPTSASFDSMTNAKRF